MQIPYHYNWTKIKPPRFPMRAIIEEYVDYRIGLKGQGALIWTNGFILVSMPVKADPDDVPGVIPITALLNARKYADRKVGKYDVLVGADMISYQAPGGEVSEMRWVSGITHRSNYPDINAVVPKPETLKAEGANIVDLNWFKLIADLFGKPERGTGFFIGEKSGLTAFRLHQTGSMNPLALTTTGECTPFTAWVLIMPQYAAI